MLVIDDEGENILVAKSIYFPFEISSFVQSLEQGFIGVVKLVVAPDAYISYKAADIFVIAWVEKP